MSWYKFTSVAVLISGLILVEGYVDYEDISNQIIEDNDYYQDYSDDADDLKDTTTQDSYNETINRVRRYQDVSRAKTLSPDDIKEVRGALNQLLEGVGLYNPFTPHTTKMIDYRPLDTEQSVSTTPTSNDLETSSTNNSEATSDNDLTSSTIHLLNTLKKIHKKYNLTEGTMRGTKSPTRSVRWTYTLRHNIERLSSILAAHEESRKALRTGDKIATEKTATIIEVEGTETIKETDVINQMDAMTEMDAISEKSWSKEITAFKYNTLANEIPTYDIEVGEIQAIKNTTVIDDNLPPINIDEKVIKENTIPKKINTIKKEPKIVKKIIKKPKKFRIIIDKMKNITTTSTTTRSPDLDIPRLLAIISDLAKDFETNLTRKLNDTLIKMSIPTCTLPTTTEETTVTDEYDANYTNAIIAKCFVCGLDISGIPQNAQCADAFAGDFLPLVPVDPSAKGKLSKYKKYCKYANLHGIRYKRTQPRAVFGKWTGGCAVRWIDLSGIYTQRVCRNRLQPTMGLHFASKRMAKLERALWNIENGCIISPVATLTPLSRGISLYARFHACVCTGNFCNSSQITVPWMQFNTILLFILLISKS